MPLVLPEPRSSSIQAVVFETSSERPYYTCSDGTNSSSSSSCSTHIFAGAVDVSIDVSHNVIEQLAIDCFG
jgi:hypothetical protein